MHYSMATLGIEGRSAGAANKMSSASMTGIATVSIPAAIGTKGGGAVMAGRSSQYQGGSTFTVFSAQGSNPLVNCKLCGKGIQKVYDKSVKGYVYSCTGAHSSKIQLPKDETKTGLQLIHPYLVLQLFIPSGQHFNFELRVSDTTNTRRKMYFSTSFSELKITPLHCQIPISMVMRNIWLSLALHVPDLFYNCFRVISFRSVEVIVLGPVCKLRKIFTLRTRLAETGGENALGIEEPLPQEHMFASGVENCSQVIDIAKLQSALGIDIPSIDARGGPESVLSARKLTLNRMEYPRQVHVAFGSRMPLVSSTAQQNTQATIEERHVREKQPKLPLPPDTSMDTTTNRTAPEKLDRRSPMLARSSTPDIQTPSTTTTKKGENNTINTAAMLVASNEAARVEKKAENAVELMKGGGAKPGKKKEEQAWKRAEIPYIANGKHGRKEAELVRAKDFRQQARYEDSPPITPCGWERSASARGSDDMNFKVHTLFEKLGDYAQDDTEIFSSMSEDGEDKEKEASEDTAAPDLAQAPQPANSSSSQAEQKPSKTIASRDSEGLKFYQFELEKDFMLREGNNSASASDDESWCSGSSGRGSPSALNDLEDLVKKTRLSGGKAPSSDAIAKEETTVAITPCDSADDLFVVHEQDHSDLNEHDSHDAYDEHDEEEFEDSGEEPVFEPHMVAKPVLKLDSMRSATGPKSARKISPGPSSSRRKSRSAQLEELCGRPAAADDLEGTSEDDLDLLYDPTLDCYYDPKTNRYYELK